MAHFEILPIKTKMLYYMQYAVITKFTIIAGGFTAKSHYSNHSIVFELKIVSVKVLGDTFQSCPSEICKGTGMTILLEMIQFVLGVGWFQHLSFYLLQKVYFKFFIEERGRTAR